MKVAALQFSPAFGDIEGNVDKIGTMISREDADLYVLPELAFSGYLFESREEAFSLAQQPGDGVFTPLAQLASAESSTIVVGFAEKDGDSLFNSSLLIRPDGSRAVYRKLHLFGPEKGLFDPGTRAPECFDVGSVRVGMMICFDWIFPEVARSLAIGGADIVCHPANLVLHHCQDAMVTRCLENRIFAITANRTGSEERAGQELTFTGRSQVVAPNGEVLVSAAYDGDDVLVADIDPAAARDKKITQANDVLLDRRPEFYGILCSGGGGRSGRAD
jgi:predicted amidohydrolase